MGKTISYEEIKNYINSEETGNGCELIMNKNEFEEAKKKQNKTNSSVKLNILCRCRQHQFNVSYSRFSHKTHPQKQCFLCGEKMRVNKIEIKYEEIKEYINNLNTGKGCLLLTTNEDFQRKKEFNNNKNTLIDLEIKCGNCGNSFNTNYNRFSSNKKQKKCPNCNLSNKTDSRTLTFDKMKRIIEVESNSGCKLLITEKEFKDEKIRQNKTPSETIVKVQCHCGNIFYTNITRFKLKKHPKQQCDECGKQIMIRKQMKNHQEFVKEIEHKFGEGEYIFLEEYRGRDKNILTKHKCGFEWKVSPHNLLNSNESRCPQCHDKNKNKTTQYFKQEVYDLVGDEYTILGEYKGAKNKILIKHNCKKCKDNKYYVTPSDFLSGKRCPICNESKGEYAIRHYCENNNINFDSQYKFDDLLGLGEEQLRFDFAIFKDKERTKLKCLIEYDGIFHYEKQYKNDGFEIVQKHDKRKDNYCKRNNIKLIRIPYWEFDNIEEILNRELKLKRKEVC